LLGPVAEAIFRLAECLIMTVTARAEKPVRAADGVRRILYATSFKPTRNGPLRTHSPWNANTARG
jgi:hypothetical protein